VAAVTTRVSVIDIKLKPTGKPLVFSPGQFGFMTVHTDAVGEESHPFSFASGPDDPVLRFAIKKSGDYTERLRKLKSGDPVSVHGPYGRFAARYLRGTTNAIWIAGGIGVTPFVSLLQHEVTQDADRQVRFYYSGLENEKDAPFAQEISQLAGKAARIKYTYFQSTRQNFLTAKHISASVPDFQTRLILICGPMVMMEALKRQFIALGVPAQNIIYEDFNLL